MMFQFSDGEFSGPMATPLKIWKKKINSFIVIIAFSVILEKLNRNPQACPFLNWGAEENLVANNKGSQSTPLFKIGNAILETIKSRKMLNFLINPEFDRTVKLKRKTC